MNRQEKKKDTACRIQGAALRLFSEKGYEAATVSEIAEAAGVSKGTFFNYFSTKDELLLSFQKSLLVSQTGGPGCEDAPHVPWILALEGDESGAMEDNRTMLRLLLQRFLLNAGTEGRSRSMGKCVESLIPVFEKGQQDGEFTGAITPREMAASAMRTYFGTLLGWSTGMEEGSLGDQLTQAFQLFINGITNK